MSNPASLKTLLSVAVIGMAVLPTLASGLLIGGSAAGRLEDAAAQSLGHFASQVAHRLDIGMHERLTDVKSMAAAVSSDVADYLGNPARARALLDHLREVVPEYAWIGLVSAEGTVLAGTDGLLEGADVTLRPWFRAGVQTPFAGDVHDAVLLAQLLEPGPDGTPLHFVDVAAPVRRADGVPVGVIGAHLDWSWAAEVQRAVLGETISDGMEALVVARDGVVLLGPAALVGQKLELRGVLVANQGIAATGRERWPDGRHYVTAAAPTRGHRDFGGLGWTVVVRQDAGAALAPARDLRRRINLMALGLTAGVLLVGLWLARRLTDPLTSLAAAADRLSRGKAGDVPYIRAYGEVAMLSAALADLETRLSDQEELDEREENCETKAVEVA